MKTKAISFVVMALVAVVSPAYAGGPAGGALEVTQWFNRGTMLSQLEQQIQQVAALASQYSTQLQQYQTQIKAGLNISNVLPGVNLQGLVVEVNNVIKFKKSLDAIAGDVSKLSTDWQSRLIEAQMGKMTLSQYAQQQSELLSQGNQRAISRIQNEQRMFAAVQDDYEVANQYASKISETSGVQESMGLMNTQMNRLIQQNARMVALAAQAQGSDKANEEAKKSIDDALFKSTTDEYLKRSIQDRADLRNKLESLGRN